MEPTNRYAFGAIDFALYIFLAADLLAIAYTYASFTTLLTYAVVLVSGVTSGVTSDLDIGWVLVKFKNKVRETLTLAGGDNGPRDAETSSRKERAKQCVRTFVPKCAWWKKASLAETLDDRNYQLKQKTSLLHALAKRFADRTAELGVVKTELAARDEVIAVQRSKIREAARVNLDNSNTNLVLSRKLKEFRNLYKDYRFHLELQRRSAATANETAASLQNEVNTANATAARLQNEVNGLRAFMTKRLGLPAYTVPTAAATAAAAAATGSDRNTSTSSTTLSSPSSDGAGSNSERNGDGIVEQAGEAVPVAVPKGPRKVPKPPTRRSWKTRI